jgi:outer membrane protein OmpA-like peptidoglycan-associated protein
VIIAIQTIMKHLLFVFFSLFLYLHASAQTPPGRYSSMDEKAIKHFQEGLKAYKLGNDKTALEELDKAEKKDPSFAEVFELRADIYADRKDYVNAIEQFKKVFALGYTRHWQNFFACARYEILLGHYEDAKIHFQQFLKAPVLDPDMEMFARLNIENCDFAVEAMKHPVPFNPINMGAAINTAVPEYFPAITVDRKKFLFTRRLKKDVGGGMASSQEDFYSSDLVDGTWTPSKPVDGINTPGNEGAPCYSANGKILFFAACQESADGSYGGGRTGYGSCDIFYSVNVNGHWTKPENVGPPVSTYDYETQPSFSSDGKSLYFIRGHIGKDHHTIQNQDIYVSTLDDNGQFGVPVRLSDKINTPGLEQSVFIHPDNNTLYFSSDGHPGMGGLDIYMSKRQPNGEWGDAVNLGYPINTCGDENSILVDPNGNLAYFASNRPGGFGDLDLYSFDLPPTMKADPVTYFKGKVYDAVTKKPLEASFDLINLATQKSVNSSISERGTGEFFMTLNSNTDYALNVSRPGYLFYSENFSLKESADKSKPFIVDVPLQPIDTGTVVLKNVFFETAKYDLKPESNAELDKLVAFLTTNKTLKIELNGHTDNVGDPKSNLLLSNNRAKAVYDYLVGKGIAKERLKYKGYGDTRPVVLNDTPEHRQLNRRTEFRITSK